ncbi:MAG: bifunctional phosphoglucose/phosphomannose isomerase [Candidatus Hydrothermia bacterium]
MDMLELIRNLPDQIEEAINYEIPDIPKPLGVFVCGMGGSAIAGDITRIIALDTKVPIEVVRDYSLPSYAEKSDLLIASSYSGNTEETLSAFEDGRKRGLSLFVVTSGGKLFELANSYNVPFVKIPEGYPPRTALGYLLTPLVMLLNKLGIIQKHLASDFVNIPSFLRELQNSFEKEDSLAIDIASKFYKRIPAIYTSSTLYPIALRWKAQINENAKAFCHTMEFPEMNHNEINGIKNPNIRCEAIWALFIQDAEDNPRIKLRFKITKDLIEESIQGYTFLDSFGSNFIERLFYLIYLGDYVSYYLAKFYNEDPVQIPRITELKRRLSE